MIYLKFENLEKYIFLNDKFIPLRYEIFKHIREEIFKKFSDIGLRFIGYSNSFYKFYAEKFDKDNVLKILSEISEDMHVCIPKIYFNRSILSSRKVTINIGRYRCFVCDRISEEFICKSCGEYLKRLTRKGFLSKNFDCGLLVHKNIDKIDEVLHLKTKYESLFLGDIFKIIETLNTIPIKNNAYLYLGGNLLRINNSIGNILYKIYLDVINGRISKYCIIVFHEFISNFYKRIKHGALAVNIPRSLKRFKYFYEFLNDIMTDIILKNNRYEAERIFSLLIRYFKMLYENYYS